MKQNFTLSALFIGVPKINNEKVTVTDLQFIHLLSRFRYDNVFSEPCTTCLRWFNTLLKKMENSRLIMGKRK
jgi:hypothetical protein